MTDLINKLLILRTPGVGPVKYAKLIDQFGSPDMVIQSMPAADELRDNVMREIERAQNLGIQFLSDDDPMYPAALKAVKNHPPILTVRGNINVFARPTVGIVGTRHATAAGMKFISDLAENFAARGFAVVSGMAMGTDTAAHRGALNANGDAVTIAVLAGGADYIWPLENESLYERIIERGAVVSEMPVGFIPVQTNFVQRNRWIAALSSKLILGEADLKSGSVHTARFATDYGRDLYAIPSHPADSRSLGPNQLIKEGAAILCTGADDFFGSNKNATKKNLNEKNDKSINPVLDALGIIPVSESVLAQLVEKSIAEIKADLVVLELQGLVAKCDGGYVKI